MSVLITVIPIDEQNFPVAIEFLKDTEIELPSDLKLGREPTVREIKNAIERLLGFVPTYDDISSDSVIRVYITYVDGLSELNISGLSLEPDKPSGMSFWGGGQVVEDIIKRLPSECGTFLILTNGENPTFIQAEGS